MEVRITWAVPPDIQITDEWDVFYREADPANINNWILANPTPLPFNTSFYDITGLNPGTVYRFGVSKSCFGTGSFVDQISYYAIACPIISVYQGAPPTIGSRSTPTLFYSVYYPDSTHVFKSSLNTLDYTLGNSFNYVCGTPGLNMAAPIGRTTYQTVDKCTSPLSVITFNNNNTDSLDLDPLHSSLTSALGYYGLGTVNPSPNPILLQSGNEYRFYIESTIQDPSTVALPPELQIVDFNNVIGTCTDVTGTSLPTFTPVTIASNPNRISGAQCYDPLTGIVQVSLKDGTNQIYPPSISSFTYTTEDSSGSTISLVNSSSVIISTSDLTFTIYCPVKMDPSLDLAQFTDNMTVNVFIHNPAPTLVCTISNVNYTGLTYAQVYNNIATYITNNSAYSADAVTVGGFNYIRLFVSGTNVVYAEIDIVGPYILGPDLPDINQVPIAPGSGGGIQTANIWSNGTDDFIIGSRGPYSGTAKIEITNITTQTTNEVSHPINFGIRKSVIVKEPVPAIAYDITNFNGEDGYYGITQAIVDNAGATWNDGFIYVPGGPSGQDVNVYDSSLVLVDTLVGVLTVPITMIEVNQLNGYIFVLGDDIGTGQYRTALIDHSATNVWAIVGNSLRNTTNQGYTGSITGRETNTVLSSTQYSITVAGTPWILNQWNGFRVEILTGAMAGKQVKLWTYVPPLNPNISNDLNTLFIEPGPSDPLFDGTSLASGDTFALMEVFYDGGRFTDTNATWTPDEWTNYNVVITSGIIKPGIFGIGNGNTSETLAVTSLAVNEGWVVNVNTYDQYPLTHGTTYRIYRNNSGDLKWDSGSNTFNYSCGGGQIAQHNGNTGAWITTQSILDENVNPLTDGAFQMCRNNSDGLFYLTIRDFANGIISDPLVPNLSKNIFIWDPGLGISNFAIDGSTRWNENICGNISYANIGGADTFYFTSRDTRTLITYTLNTDAWVTTTIPPVYFKAQSVERIQGAVLYDTDRLIIMNRLDNSSSPTLRTAYIFTNLFVYNLATEEIEQVLVGADSTPYSGSYNTWNPNSYGEMFAEYMGQKSYGFGGLSIKVVDGKIYWKQCPELHHYRSLQYNETGVAQIWGNSLVSNLVRIWNIQSDGTVVPSVRTLFNHGVSSTNRSLTYAWTNIDIDLSETYTDVVFGISIADSRLDAVYVHNLTGSYNGMYYASYAAYNPPIAIQVNEGPFPRIFNPFQFSVTGGFVYVFGTDGAGPLFGQSLCKKYDINDLFTPSIIPVLTKVIGDGTNPGLYNPSTYPQVIGSDGNIWKMGNATRDVEVPNPNPPPPANITVSGDRIIGVFDPVTLNQVETINLTAANAVPINPTGIEYNHFYCAPFDKMVYYGPGAGDLIVFVDPTTYQIEFKGDIDIFFNFKRPLALTVNKGWMVSYGLGFFLDYYGGTAGATTERWSYIITSNIDYTGLINDTLNVIYNNNPPPLITDNIYSTGIVASTFGQWKVTTALPLPGDDVVYWNYITGSGFIAINANETLELTQFSMENPIVSVENLTQTVLYEITDPIYLNVNTLPTFNTLNSVPFFAIKADSVNLFNNDVLQLTFENPVNPTCPFITTVTINF